MEKSVDFKLLYSQVRNDIKKDANHDLYMSIGGIVIGALLFWFYYKEVGIYVGVGLFLLFMIRYWVTKQKLPVIFMGTLAEKKKVKYSRMSTSENPVYDYFINLDLEDGHSFSDKGIVKPTGLVKPVQIKIFNVSFFETLQEGEKAGWVFSSAGSFLGVWKEGRYWRGNE